MIRIVAVEPLPGCRLKVAFNDGVSGIFSVVPEQRGGVFLKLLDPSLFNAVTINPDFGCVEWPGGLDLCPDTMHQAMTGAEVEAELEGVFRETANKPTIKNPGDGQNRGKF